MIDNNIDWPRVWGWLTKPCIGCRAPEVDADKPAREPPAGGVVRQPPTRHEPMVAPSAPRPSPADVGSGVDDMPETDPLVEAAGSAALLEAWLLLKEELPDQWQGVAMQWLQLVGPRHSMAMAEEIIASYRKDEFVAAPDDQEPAASGREAGQGASRVARFDINPPGEERIVGEGGPKEFAMRQKHRAEGLLQRVQRDAEQMIHGGAYFSREQQDEWTVRTIRDGDRTLFCKKSGELFDSPEKPVNFVVLDDPDYPEGNGERLIMCPEKNATGAKYSTHSQLSRGKPVKYAGEMRLEGGVPTRYNLKAGHYRQPTPEKAQRLRDHRTEVADQKVRLELLVRNAAGADAVDEADYCNDDRHRQRMEAIDGEFSLSTEKAAKFAQYIARKFGAYVATDDAAEIDDDVSTVEMALEEMPPSEAGA
jgi:hypothetical protein